MNSKKNFIQCVKSNKTNIITNNSKKQLKNINIDKNIDYTHLNTNTRKKNIYSNYKQYNIQNKLEYNDIAHINLKNKKVNHTYQHLNKNDAITSIINLSLKLKHSINSRNLIAIEFLDGAAKLLPDSLFYNKFIDTIYTQYSSTLDEFSRINKKLNQQVKNATSFHQLTLNAGKHLIYYFKKLTLKNSKLNKDDLVELENIIIKTTLLEMTLKVTNNIQKTNQPINKVNLYDFCIVIELLMYFKFKYFHTAIIKSEKNYFNELTSINETNINYIINILSDKWIFNKTILFYFIFQVLNTTDLEEEFLRTNINNNYIKFNNSISYSNAYNNFIETENSLASHYLSRFLDIIQLNKHSLDCNYYSKLVKLLSKNISVKKIIDYYGLIGKSSKFKYDKYLSTDLIIFYTIQIFFNNILYNKFKTFSNHHLNIENSKIYKECVLYKGRNLIRRHQNKKLSSILESLDTYDQKELKKNYFINPIQTFSSTKFFQFNEWDLLKYQLNFLMIICNWTFKNIQLESLLQHIESNIFKATSINYFLLQNEVPFKQSQISITLLKSFYKTSENLIQFYSNQMFLLKNALSETCYLSEKKVLEKQYEILKTINKIMPKNIILSKIKMEKSTLKNSKQLQSYNLQTRIDELTQTRFKTRQFEPSNINSKENTYSLTYIPLFIQKRYELFKSRKLVDNKYQFFQSTDSTNIFKKVALKKPSFDEHPISKLHINKINKNRELLSENYGSLNTFISKNPFDNLSFIKKTHSRIFMDFINKNRDKIFSYSRYHFFKYSHDNYLLNLQTIIFKFSSLNIIHNNFIAYFIYLALNKINKNFYIPVVKFINFYRFFINPSVRIPNEIPSIIINENFLLTKNVTNKNITTYMHYSYINRLILEIIKKHFKYKYILPSSRKSHQYLVSFLYKSKAYRNKVALQRQYRDHLILSIFIHFRLKNKEYKYFFIDSLIYSLTLSKKEVQYILGCTPITDDLNSKFSQFQAFIKNKNRKFNR